MRRGRVEPLDTGSRRPSLSVDDLEDGLRSLAGPETDPERFWTENGGAFRETVRLAIRETAEALLFHEMPSTLRVELECQLEWLKNYAAYEDDVATSSDAIRKTLPLLSKHRVH
jgi:hypothetical protein